MRCMKCGTEIPEDSFYCPKCASPVQIVPDYSAFENYLADEINELMRETDGVDGKTRVLNDEDMRRSRSGQSGPRSAAGRQTINMTQINRNVVDGSRRSSETSKTRIMSSYDGNGSGRKSVQGSVRSGVQGSTGRVRSVAAAAPSTASRTKGNTSAAEAEKRRKQQEAKKKALQKKKQQKRRMIIILVLAVVIVATGIILLLNIKNNTYTGVMNKAEKAFTSESYEDALNYYKKAASMKNTKPDPYLGMARCYVKLSDFENAENAYLTAIDKDEECSDAYLELCQMYESREELSQIALLFEDVDSKKVLKACKDYIAQSPQITPEGGTFDEPVKVEMKSEEETIYYTTDGSEPGTDSLVYSEPFELEENGDYTIRAISVNSKGFISRETVVDYKLELNLPDGPNVVPDAGTYTTYTSITVDIPDGCTVYYTLDGSDPTQDSNVYYGPIDMPEGESVFSCISVNEYGMESSVIRRQYNLMILE